MFVSKLIVMCLAVTLRPGFVNCDNRQFFNDILRTCYEEDNCGYSKEQLSEIGSKAYNEKMYHFMTSGIPRIFWDNVRTKLDVLEQFNISSSCHQSLIVISDGLMNGNHDAFRFLDSSGKTPSSLMESTITTLGDYDECLDIAMTSPKAHVQGQYCSIDIFPLKRHGERSSEQFTIGKLNSYSPGYAISHGLCFPADCHVEDIQQLVTDAVEPYFLKVNGFLDCDTKQSISYATRFWSMTSFQIYSLIYIAITVWFVVTATLWTELSSFLRHFPEVSEYIPSTPSIVEQFSIVSSAKALFLDKTNGHELLSSKALNLCKLAIVMGGVAAHIATCIELPNSYFMITRLSVFREILSSFRLQPFLNDAGLQVMSVLTGYSMFSMAYAFAKSGKLPYAFAVVDRYLRFVPGIAALTAMEILWPLWASGPMYTRVGNFITKKCEQNAWMNFLFINNWISSIDICVGHTYYSSIDFQVFVLGLIALYCFSRSLRSGTKFCLGALLVGNLWLGWNAWRKSTTVALLMPESHYLQVLDYLDYIHMHIAPYIIGHFYGMLAGVILEMDFKWNPTKLVHHVIINSMFNSTLSLGAFVLALKRSFDLVPDSWGWVIILINRNAVPMSAVIYIIYFKSIKSWNTPHVEPTQCDECQEIAINNPIKPISKVHYSLLKGLCRLSLCIYLVNFLVIRTEFFTTRNLLTGQLSALMVRMIASLVMIIVTAFGFHVLFVAPFEVLRERLFSTLLGAKKAKSN